ncbi:MAG: HEAT repeat domain-containing protein [Desulfobulbaceae bacterium]|nr:HEAT repeat domain-containing protein [Desulfobulbaceae bacterium]
MTHKWLQQLQTVHRIFLGAGFIAVLIFGYTYLIAARSDCGVVRFYEYTFGFTGLVIWGGGNLIALLLLLKQTKTHIARRAGTFFLIATNSLMIWVTSALLYSFMDSRFVFTGTESLIQRVEKEDDRLAALELGRRNVKKSVPLLCRIVLAPGKDINLRLNAVYALREIGSGLSRDDTYYEETVVCLVQLLNTPNPYLRSSAIETMGILQEPQTVLPLLRTLEKEDDEFVKEDTVRVLGLLGDTRAHEPLTALLADKNNNYSLNYTIKQALKKIEDTENNNRDN